MYSEFESLEGLRIFGNEKKNKKILHLLPRVILKLKDLWRRRGKNGGRESNCLQQKIHFPYLGLTKPIFSTTIKPNTISFHLGIQ